MSETTRAPSTITNIGVTMFSVDVDPEPMAMPGTPTMFSLRDPSGNAVWVVQA